MPLYRTLEGELRREPEPQQYAVVGHKGETAGWCMISPVYDKSTIPLLNRPTPPVTMIFDNWYFLRAFWKGDTRFVLDHYLNMLRWYIARLRRKTIRAYRDARLP